MKPNYNERYYNAFLENKDDLLAGAQEARGYADSYRNYHVGAAALGWSEKKGKYKVFRGCNMKPAHDGEKMCAERVAVGAAKSYGCNPIVALAIVGEPQREEGDTNPTLHPCVDCLKFLSAVHGCDEQTIVLTEWNGVEEVHTIAELIGKHNGTHAERI